MPATLDDLLTPALLVRMDRVRHNVAELLRRVDGATERLRPHLKTTKIPEVWQVLLDVGLRHFKCATTREAALLLELAESQGLAVDLLVAFAHRGANLERLAGLAESHGSQAVSILTEDAAHARAVRAASHRLGLWIDLDPQWGRSGIPLDDELRIRLTDEACGEALRGLHLYEGHLTDEDPSARRTRGFASYTSLVSVAEALEARRGSELALITSGTPGFEAALAFEGFRSRRHQISPGTLVFFDGTSKSYGIEGFEFAATVLSTIISAPRAGSMTCDAGSKAIDAACGTPCAEVVDRPDLIAQVPSEEHLPLRGEGELLAPGARIELVPRHVCPTVNLADEAVLLDEGSARSIVPVAARGHELRAP